MLWPEVEHGVGEWVMKDFLKFLHVGLENSQRLHVESIINYYSHLIQLDNVNTHFPLIYVADSSSFSHRYSSLISQVIKN